MKSEKMKSVEEYSLQWKILKI